MSPKQWFLVAAFCAAFLFSDFDNSCSVLPDGKSCTMIAAK